MNGQLSMTQDKDKDNTNIDGWQICPQDVPPNFDQRDLNLWYTECLNYSKIL